jgi:hypothetical protein
MSAIMPTAGYVSLVMQTRQYRQKAGDTEGIQSRDGKSRIETRGTEMEINTMIGVISTAVGFISVGILKRAWTLPRGGSLEMRVTLGRTSFEVVVAKDANGSLRAFANVAVAGLAMVGPALA